MQLVKNFRIEIDRRQVNTCGDYTDLRVWLYFDLEENASQKSWLNFLFIGDEWFDAFDCRKSVFADVAHRIDTFGEDWTFFDKPVPAANAGVTPLAYVRIKFPYHVREKVIRDIRHAIEEYDADPDKEKVILDYTGRLEEWRTHGQGTGQVEYKAYDETKELIAKYRGEPTFDRCITTIESIARNTTARPADVGVVQIGAYGVKDGCTQEFGWSAGSLVGGIINHGTEEKPDWSVHT